MVNQEKNPFEKEGFYQKVIDKVDRMSLFLPNSLITHKQSVYSLTFEYDANKLSKREVHKVLKSLKDLKRRLREDTNQKVSFIIKKKNLKSGKMNLFVENAYLSNLSLLYRHHNKDINIKQRIEKDRPILNDLNNNFRYRFDHEKYDVNQDNLLNFLQ